MTARTLPPDTQSRLAALKFEARRAVESALAGLHASPHHGASIEFTEHKEYVPGDDIRRIDWRVYGKIDKYYIKRFEKETSLKALFLVDSSGSMEYRSHALSKLDYASRLALGLAFLLLNQGDGAGLTIRSGQSVRHLPPAFHRAQFDLMAEALAAAEGEGESPVGNWMEALTERGTQANLVAVVSDFFTDEARVLDSLKRISSRRREILFFHILDPNELTFPFSNRTRFIDMETPRDLTLEPLSIRAGYLEEMRAFIERLRDGCHTFGADYLLCDTSVPLERTLSDFIGRRSAGG
ncbi:MAG: DUF58 domain-containing protein [Fibrobacterota bacterium]